MALTKCVLRKLSVHFDALVCFRSLIVFDTFSASMFCAIVIGQSNVLVCVIV